MPVLVDHRNAFMPDPTPEVIEAMAKAGYDVFQDALRTSDVQVPPRLIPEWTGCSQELREKWKLATKAMYGTLAMFGGANLKVLDDCVPAKARKKN